MLVQFDFPPLGQGGRFAPSLIVTNAAPEAKAALERMDRAYANARSFRCSIIGWKAEEKVRAEVAYDQLGNALIRRLNPDREGTLAEFRAWGRKLVVWSPKNRHRYLRTLLDPTDTRLIHLPKPGGLRATAFRTLEKRAGMEESRLAEFLESSPSGWFVGWNAVIRYDGRAQAADGTVVDVVSVDHFASYATGRLSGMVSERDVYQIGVADGFLRRYERRGGGKDGNDLDQSWEFRNVRAAPSIPLSVFAFRPPKETLPVDLPHEPPPPSVATLAVSRGMVEALRSAVTVGFRTEWQRTIGMATDGATPPQRGWVASSRFVWTRPQGLTGEVRWRDVGDPERVSLHTSGDALLVRKEGDPEEEAVPIGTAHPLWGLGGRTGVGDVARGAALFLREIVAATGDKAKSGLEGFSAVAPRTLFGERVDVLENVKEYAGEFGIPGGTSFVQRLFVGAKDHLPRLYETVSESDREFGRSRVRTTERFFDLAKKPRR